MNIIIKHLVFIILVLLSNACMNSQNTVESIMKEYAENGRKEIGSPFTGTVLIAKNGNIQFTGAYGLKDRNHNILNEIDTKFPIGSLTKQFTAMLIMQLVEEGALKLNDTLSKYLTYLPKEFSNKITIHQLLSHTSGLPHYEGLVDTEMNIRTFTKSSYTPKELALLVSKVKLIDKPGAVFHYSSLGYMLLGCILEEVTGNTFSEVLKTKIVTPLGLKNTGFASNKFIKNETAKGYTFKEDKTYKMIFIKYGGEFKEVPHRDQSNSYSAGGMHSTVNDLFVWSEAIRNNTLLSSKLSAKMLQPIKQGYGYGWVRNWENIIERNTRAKLYSHTGSTFGHAAAISMFDDGTTIIFTSNVNKIKAQKIIHTLYLAANELNDVYKLKGYPDRSSINKFEKEGGVKALNAYFKKLSDLCGYEVKPSEGSIQQITAMYYNKGYNKKADSLKNAYFKNYSPSERDIIRLGYRIVKSNCNKAIEVFEEATRAFPNSANSWDSLGEAYLACKAYKKAVRSFDKVVKIATKTKDSRLDSFQENLEKAKLLLNSY